MKKAPLYTKWISRSGKRKLLVQTFDEDHQMNFIINSSMAYSLNLEEAEDLIKYLKSHVANEKLYP